LRDEPVSDSNLPTVQDPFQAILAQALGLLPDDPVGKVLMLPGAAESAATGLTGTTSQSKTDTRAEVGDVFPPAVTAGELLFSPTSLVAIPLQVAAGDPGSLQAPADNAGFTALTVSANTMRLEPGPEWKKSSAGARVTDAPGVPQELLAMHVETADADRQLPEPRRVAELALAAKLPPANESGGRPEMPLIAHLPDPANAPQIPAPIQHPSIAQAAGIAPAPTTIVEPRVASPGWNRSLGDKLMWMADRNQQVAQLHLNPPELGPLQITLTLDNDKASAQFVSAHAVVRDAIETAMPRLRDMLAESGISLGNASVGAEASSGQPQSQRNPHGYGAKGGGTFADTGPASTGERTLYPSRGLVDTFA